MKLASEAARFVVRELERVAGQSVLSTISDFFAAMAESMDAIVDRLHKTEALLHSPAVRFVLVTTAETDRLRQARELIDEMDSEGLKLAAIVVNRFLDERTWHAVADSSRDSVGEPLAHLEEISELRNEVASSRSSREGSQNDGAGASLAKLIDYFEEYRHQTLDEIQRVADFARMLPAGVKLAIAPKIEAGVLDLGALARVAEYVTSGVAILKPLEAASAKMRHEQEKDKTPETSRRFRTSRLSTRR
jgi:anion-transporting  ArsA/GET3 family ATPase